MYDQNLLFLRVFSFYWYFICGSSECFTVIRRQKHDDSQRETEYFQIFSVKKSEFFFHPIPRSLKYCQELTKYL